MSRMSIINLLNEPPSELSTNRQVPEGTSQIGSFHLLQQRINSPSRANLGQFLQKQTLETSSQQDGDRSTLSSGAVQGECDPEVATRETPDRHDDLIFTPLDRDRFSAILQKWWKKVGITFDPSLSIGNVQVDVNQLYQLHCEVLRLGGFVKVRFLRLPLQFQGLICLSGAKTRPVGFTNELFTCTSHREGEEPQHQDK